MPVQPSHSDISRDLGKVEGTVEAMGKRLDRIEEAMANGFKEIKELLSAALEDGHTRHKGVDDRLKVVEAREERRRGAWGVIVLIASAVGGVVAWIAGKLF